MFTDTNDFSTSLPRHILRSVLFRSGLAARLGPKYWQPADAAPYIHVLQSRPVEMFSSIPSNFLDPVYNDLIGPDSARWSGFDERITAIDDCWVEPNRCQVIGPDGRLVSQSITHRLLPLFPSAWGHATRGAGTKLPEAIVYDGFNSTNYYHHLIDTLPSIELFLERSGLASDIPLVVNRRIFDSRFFAYLHQRSPSFAGLNWRVQEPGEWLRIGRAYRLHAAPFSRASFSKVKALYGQVSEPKERRIFLSRDPKMYGRGIHNERQVSELLAKHGFDTVYAEHLSLEEQQRMFEETTHLVALQGMGLVQQMFMHADKGHVLELMPVSRLQSEYYWQGWTLGMRFYDVQTGSALDGAGMYSIDTERLETGVRRMLDHSPSQRRYGETLIADGQAKEI